MRVPVTDLVGRPGRTREVDTTVTPADDELSWGPAEDALTGPIRLRLHLDAVTDGIIVRGTVTFVLEVPCARCLEPQRETHVVDVTELFRDPTRVDVGTEGEAEQEDGYELTHDLTAIDLTAMLHDVVVMDVPLRVLCRDGCQGLCPRCGADRNVEDCGHDLRPGPDPRWAKLAELDVPASRN